MDFNEIYTQPFYCKHLHDLDGRILYQKLNYGGYQLEWID
jgi:hypothetical protein